MNSPNPGDVSYPPSLSFSVYTGRPARSGEIIIHYETRQIDNQKPTEGSVETHEPECRTRPPLHANYLLLIAR